MKGLLLLLIFAVSGAWAQGYKSIELKSAPAPVLEKLDEFFAQQGFWTFKGRPEFAELGLNRLYFSEEFRSFVAMKYAVEGEVPLDELIPFDGGQAYHHKHGDKIVAYYFVRLDADQTQRLTRTLSKLELPPEVSLLRRWELIPTAHATCQLCGMPMPDSENLRSFSQMGISTIMAGLSRCLSASGNEIANTGGIRDFFSGVSTEFQKIRERGWSRVSDYGTAIANTAVGFANFIGMIASAILDPVGSVEQLRRALGESGAILGALIRAVTHIPISSAIPAICALLTGIGVRTLISAFSGGAGLALLAAKLGRLGEHLLKLVAFFRKLKQLGLNTIEELGLTPAHLGRMFERMASGTFDHRRLEALTKVLGLGSPLAQRMGLTGFICSLQ